MTLAAGTIGAMPTPGDTSALHVLFLLLAGAAVTLYIASKAAVDALMGRFASTSGRLAWGHSASIAAVAMTAMAMGAADVAVGVILASSTVCLTLGMSSLLLVGKAGGVAVRRLAAAMLLPATLLVFVAGFHGRLTLIHAGSLVLLGVMTVQLWGSAGGESGAAPVVVGRGPVSPRVLQLVLALMLACIGGWAAVHGITQLHPFHAVASPGILIVTLLAPLLILPLLGTSVDLAHHDRSAVAFETIIGVVLVNLCLLLPVCVVEATFHPVERTYHAVTHRRNLHAATTQPAAAADSAPETGLPFPRLNWRVDAVGLIVLATMLLPVTLGRWPLTRSDGLGLLVGYLLYIAVTIGVQLRAG